MEKEELVCRLMRYHCPIFFDNIRIPYSLFKRVDWDVSRVMYDNSNILFYSNKYIDGECREEKEVIIKKYNDMVLKIFRSEILIKLLMKWTENINYIPNDNFFILSILKNKKYSIISPNYIIDTYIKCINLDGSNANDMLKKCLGEILNIVDNELRLFKIKYMGYSNKLMRSNKKKDNDHLLLKMFKCILLFCDKLIDLNIYAIYNIVNGVVRYN